MSKNLSGGEFLLYQTEDAQNRVECLLPIKTSEWSGGHGEGLSDQQAECETPEGDLYLSELVQYSVVNHKELTAADGKRYG